MRRDERQRADDVAEPLSEFAQIRAVLDFHENGPKLDCRGHQKGAICPELTFRGLLSTGGLYTHDGTLPGP